MSRCGCVGVMGCGSVGGVVVWWWWLVSGVLVCGVWVCVEGGRGDVDAEGLERMDVQPFGQIEKTLSRRSVPAFFNPSRPSWCPKNLFLVWPSASVGTTIHTGTQESREAIPADDDQSNTKVKPNSHSQVKKLVEAVGRAHVFCSVKSETEADQARSFAFASWSCSSTDHGRPTRRNSAKIRTSMSCRLAIRCHLEVMQKVQKDQALQENR